MVNSALSLSSAHAARKPRASSGVNGQISGLGHVGISTNRATFRGHLIPLDGHIESHPQYRQYVMDPFEEKPAANFLLGALNIFSFNRARGMRPISSLMCSRTRPS